METRRVPVAEGVELAVDVWPEGDGVPLVLVHGLASNARLWDGVARHLQGLGHPVAAFDQRGHGRSSKPDTGFGYAEVTSDLSVVIAALGWERSVVAGQSWGGSVALELAARRPGLLRGIVGVDGGFLDLAGRFPTWDECRAELEPPSTSGMTAADIESTLRQAHPDWSADAIGAALACYEIRADETVAPWLAREAHLEILGHMWEHRPAPLFSALEVPALLIVANDAVEKEWTAGKRRDVAAVEVAADAGGTTLQVHWMVGDHDLHAQHPLAVAELMHGALRDGLF